MQRTCFRVLFLAASAIALSGCLELWWPPWGDTCEPYSSVHARLAELSPDEVDLDASTHDLVVRMRQHMVAIEDNATHVVLEHLSDDQDASLMAELEALNRLQHDERRATHLASTGGRSFELSFATADC